MYGDLMDVYTLHEVEKALGFELTPSQIAYVMTGEMRYTGKTTAEAIKEYLECLRSNKPLVYYPSSVRHYNECRHKVAIIHKLIDSGLPNIDIKIRRV
jgi:hypothetical protein